MFPIMHLFATANHLGFIARILFVFFLLIENRQLLAADESEPNRLQRFSIDFNLPSNSFAIKGLDPNLSTQNKVANASFTPKFSPQLRIGYRYSQFEVGYTSHLGSTHAFYAIDGEIPIWNTIVIGGFWRDFSGFNEQFTLEDNNQNSSTISYNSSAPTWNREDVRFADRSIYLRRYSSDSLFPLNIGEINLDLSFKLYYGFDYRYQRLSSISNLIVDSYQDQFGSGAKIQSLKQYLFGPHAGVESQLKLQSAVIGFGFDAGIAALFGSTHFQDSTTDESATKSAATVGTHIGYNVTGIQNSYGIDLRMAGLLSTIRNLGFSSIFLALQLNYQYKF